jgi:hypothetical protein
MSTPLIRNAIEDFLAQQATTKHHGRGRLIFALDATASRQETWDHAVKLQADMFREVAAIGKLDVQLVYFRGMHGIDGECRASSWASDALQLARLMNHVTCRAGHTQITRVLRHALHETTTGQPGARSATSATCARTIRTSLCKQLEPWDNRRCPPSCFRTDVIQAAGGCFRTSSSTPTASKPASTPDPPVNWPSSCERLRCSPPVD